MLKIIIILFIVVIAIVIINTIRSGDRKIEYENRNVPTGKLFTYTYGEHVYQLTIEEYYKNIAKDISEKYEQERAGIYRRQL